jgi:hypothetical protein
LENLATKLIKLDRGAVVLPIIDECLGRAVASKSFEPGFSGLVNLRQSPPR